MMINDAERRTSRTYRRRETAALPALVTLLIVGSPGLRAQGTAKVDFGRDVQPIFKTYCVKRRALPIQPYFESGFPHGHDQFISAAATNWATTALALATPKSGAANRECRNRRRPISA
jgi:hypothetical protein